MVGFKWDSLFSKKFHSEKSNVKTHTQAPKKRLGIQLFFDKDGLVDDYVLYMLKKMKEQTDDLFFICNGEITKESRAAVAQYADKIYQREKAGYDAGAWRDLFLGNLGKIDFTQYNEVVLFNDSFYGPLYPLSELFTKMDARKDLDFWGITKHDVIPELKGKESISAYIQSWFIAIRKPILRDERFYQFWRELIISDSLQEAIYNFEIIFTKHFSDLGYKWDIYADFDDWVGNTETVNIDGSFYAADYLIKEKRVPFIMRKTLYDSLDIQLIRNDNLIAKTCLNFIKNETDYPEQMIYKHLIRTRNIRELYDAWHLDYFLSENHHQESDTRKRNVALVMHLYYPELFAYCAKYASSMPEYADIYITTSRKDHIEEIREAFQNVSCQKFEIIEADNQGRDLGGLLIAARPILMQYDYICFIHDKRSLGMAHPEEGRHFCNMLFGGMLESKAYVENILHTFEENPFLGVLAPPIPFAGAYLKAHTDLWVTDANLQNMQLISKRLGLHCNLDRRKDPLTIGSAFWCRTAALRKLFTYDWQLSDFPENLIGDGSLPYALERSFGYVAQDAGYYTGIVYPDGIAEDYFATFAFMYRNILKELYEYPDLKFGNFSQLKKRLEHKRKAELTGFDEDYYFSRYPDVAASGISPQRHYLKWGKQEGRFMSQEDEDFKTNY